MDKDLNKLSDEDAVEILEHLRSKVREFGFGELDADIGASLIELGIGTGVTALERYFGDLFWFLKVFDEASINKTQSELEEHLKGDWSWRLLPGGDPEARGDSDNAYSNGIQNMATYGAVGGMRHTLANLMRELGIDVPLDDGDEPPNQPESERDR